MVRHKHIEEVVEDSEPEREELRRREKKERSGKRKRALEIIELTASESDTPAVSGDLSVDVPKGLSSPKSVTNHADTAQAENGHKNFEMTERHPVPWGNGTILEISDDNTNASRSPDDHADKNENSPVASILGPVMFTPPIASLSVSSDSETEEDELGINLARFAYQGGSRPPAAPQIKPGLITVARIEDTRDPTLNKKSIRRTGPHSTTDFSDIAIAKLTTCISCNLKWTARKSAVEKMKHVKSCAKKNSLADETVRVLIRQEIDKAPVNAKEKGKGKLVHLEPPKEPNTVLEDVINDRGPKKRGKRPAVTKTVKSLTETRDVILDRARTILGNADDVDSSIQTQAFGPSKLIGGLPRSEMARIPPTQPFGQSALRQAQKDIRPNPILALAPMSDRVGVVSDSEHSDDSDVKKILPTQKFAPSKLGEPRAHPVSSGSGVIDSGLPSALAMSPEPGVLTIASPSQGSGSSLGTFPPPFSPFADTVSLEHSPHRRPQTTSGKSVESLPCTHPLHIHEAPQTLEPTSEKRWTIDEILGTPIDAYDGPAWQNNNSYGDDAYLHFNPGVEIHDQHQPIVTNDPVSYNGRDYPHLYNTTHTVSRKYISPEESETAKQLVTREKAKSKRKLRNGEDDDDELDDNLETKLKDMILKDDTLYQRILRYEPIHLDVFFQLLSEQGLPRGVRIKLRPFLDKLAVNFYGANPMDHRR